jgi:hypothetical protein
MAKRKLYRTRRRQPRPNPGLGWVVLVALALALDKGESVLPLVNGLADVLSGLSWRAQRYLVSASEIVPALLLGALLLRDMPRSQVRTRALLFLGSTVAYYTALFFSQPHGVTSLGQNPLLEVIALALGLTAFDLSTALAPARSACVSKWCAHAPAALALGLAGAVLMTDGDSRLWVSALGVSPFVACGGFSLWWVTRASSIAQLALSIYWLGLLARSVLILDSALAESGAVTFGYYATMIGKFGCFAVIGAPPLVALPRSDRRSRSLASRIDRWWWNDGVGVRQALPAPRSAEAA